MTFNVHVLHDVVCLFLLLFCFFNINCLFLGTPKQLRSVWWTQPDSSSTNFPCTEHDNHILLPTQLIVSVTCSSLDACWRSVCLCVQKRVHWCSWCHWLSGYFSPWSWLLEVWFTVSKRHDLWKGTRSRDTRVFIYMNCCVRYAERWAVFCSSV